MTTKGWRQQKDGCPWDANRSYTEYKMRQNHNFNKNYNTFWKKKLSSLQNIDTQEDGHIWIKIWNSLKKCVKSHLKFSAAYPCLLQQYAYPYFWMEKLVYTMFILDGTLTHKYLWIPRSNILKTLSGEQFYEILSIPLSDQKFDYQSLSYSVTDFIPSNDHISCQSCSSTNSAH